MNMAVYTMAQHYVCYMCAIPIYMIMSVSSDPFCVYTHIDCYMSLYVCISWILLYNYVNSHACYDTTTTHYAIMCQ